MKIIFSLQRKLKQGGNWVIISILATIERKLKLKVTLIVYFILR